MSSVLIRRVAKELNCKPNEIPTQLTRIQMHGIIQHIKLHKQHGSTNYVAPTGIVVIN